MNTSIKRFCSAFACAIVLSVTAVFMYWHFKGRDELPEQVSTALSRVETLPPGILQRDIFPLLGMSKDDCLMIDERITDGKSGRTWTRYQIGSTTFVLECESRIKPFGLEGDVEAGVLLSAIIRKRVQDSDGEAKYVSLMPSWSEINPRAKQ